MNGIIITVHHFTSFIHAKINSNVGLVIIIIKIKIVKIIEIAICNIIINDGQVKTPCSSSRHGEVEHKRRQCDVNIFKKYTSEIVISVMVCKQRVFRVELRYMTLIDLPIG